MTNQEKQDERHKAIVMVERSLMYIAAAAAALMMALGSPSKVIHKLYEIPFYNKQRLYYTHHNHQPSRIERVLYDYDKDGRYDSGTIRIIFKDGCVKWEKLPWYATGKTRSDYEEIFWKVDSTDTLDQIEETLTFE